MNEKQPFFYKESSQGRIDLSKDFMNAFPSDSNLNTLPQQRQSKDIIK